MGLSNHLIAVWLKTYLGMELTNIQTKLQPLRQGDGPRFELVAVVLAHGSHMGLV
jgi:hypothetical protein